MKKVEVAVSEDTIVHGKRNIVLRIKVTDAVPLIKLENRKEMDALEKVIKETLGDKL